MSGMSSVSSSIAILGAGNLGSAIAKRLVEVGYRVYVTGRRKAILDELQNLGCRVETNPRAVERCDVVIVTVKPNDVLSLLGEIKNSVRGKTLISFAAMVKLREMKEILEDVRIIRAMTNLFAESGNAFTVYYSEGDVSDIADIFSSLGEAERVDEERIVDVMTAFSGSSPAFVAKLISGFVYAGLSCGLSAELSKKATLSVFRATARHLGREGEDEFIKRVTTPGGTTIQGLKKMMEYRVEFALIEALEAAARKSLGGSGK
jgi:pyrroline-5-carboxylate reductase